MAILTVTLCNNLLVTKNNFELKEIDFINYKNVTIEIQSRKIICLFSILLSPILLVDRFNEKKFLNN